MEMEHAPQEYQAGHPKTFATLAEQAIRRVAPNATGKELVALFGGKVGRTAIVDWRSGRRPMPQWAIDRLQQETKEIARVVAKLSPGPGRSDLPFRRWRAQRTL